MSKLHLMRNLEFVETRWQRLVQCRNFSVSDLDILVEFLTGDNLIVGSYDRRLCWFDLDLSTKPYKTLRLVIIFTSKISIFALITVAELLQPLHCCCKKAEFKPQM